MDTAMTPLEHLREAERLLRVAANHTPGTDLGAARLAEVHTQLAVAISATELAELSADLTRKALHR